MFLRLTVTLTMISALMTSMTAQAALVPGIRLDVQVALDAFNGMNDGRGMYFTHAPNTLATVQQKKDDLGGFYGFADLSAYVHGLTAGTTRDGADYFYTFCIEPNVSAPPDSSRALLSYENKMTTTYHTGEPLLLGGAYLYAQWAMGTLDGFNYAAEPNDHEYEVLRNTIRGFSGAAQIDQQNDPYIALLLAMPDTDMDYWMQPYDPGAYYSEIGHYSVFVMTTFHMNIEGASYQNLLYITEVPHLPEPATMTLLALGGLAMMKRRSRR